MKAIRAIGVSLVLFSLIASTPLAHAAAQDVYAVEQTRLESLYDASLKKDKSDPYIEKRIADERARVRGAADAEVKQITMPTDIPATEETATPKALDRQRAIVRTLEETLRERKVDLDLLKAEEKNVYLSPASASGSNADLQITKTYPELLAHVAILEERIAAIETALLLQRDRESALQRSQIFEQFGFLFDFLSYVVIVLVGIVIDRVMRRILIGRFHATGKRYLIAKILAAVIYTITVLWILTKVFTDHPGAIASLAIISAGIALSLQDILKDVVGWVMIVQRRLFTLGDRIAIGERTGDVIDISLLRTTVLDVSAPGASPPTSAPARRSTCRTRWC